MVKTAESTPSAEDGVTQPESTSGSINPFKRKKTADDNQQIKKKPRTRVSFSCGECHRRKQKCDRQVPCGHCIARKVPELCKAYTPGKSEQDLHLRLSRIENIIERALPHLAKDADLESGFADGSLGRQRSPSGSPDDDADDDDGAAGRLTSGRWHGVSAIGSVSSGPILEQLQTIMPQGNIGQQDSAIRDSISHLSRLSQCSKELALASRHLSAARGGDAASLAAATAIIDAVRHYADPVDPEGGSGSGVGALLNPAGADRLAMPTFLEDAHSAAERLKSLIQDCGVSPHKVSELIQELPPKRITDALVDHYFSNLNYVRYPLYEKDFRTAYEAICASHGIGVNPNDVSFLPLLFVVLALAVRVSPESLGGDDRQRRLSSLRYYWSSRRSMLLAAAIHNDSIELVSARLLSARFLTFDRRITECWSQLGAAVRTAQALGLHRDGSQMGLDSFQTEQRRRIWAYIYHADRSYALVMGRPQSISDDYTSAKPPLNVTDEELLANPSNPPDHPLNHPTPVTFVILRHYLARIIGAIAHHFHRIRNHSPYSEVLALDDDLQRFLATLPPHFALNPDKSLDESHPYIPIHRFNVLTEVLFVRMSLHRPYILRRLDSDKFARSRRACFEAAKLDFTIRREFKRTGAHVGRRLLGTAYREFQTAMISGISLVLDPNGPDSADMHQILDTFLQDHQGVLEVDDTTRRELKIVQFLKSKALDPRNTGTSASGSVGDAMSPGSLNSGPSKIPTSDSRTVIPSNGQPPDQHRNGKSTHRTYPSLDLTRDGTNPPSQYSSYPATPVTNSASYPPPNLVASPTFARLQHTDNVGSPSASNSPGADEGNAAQHLLDHWMDNVSNGPAGGGVYGPPLTAGSAAVPGVPWVSGMEVPGAGPVNTGLMVGGDLQVPGSIEADWTYWETMLNMLPNGRGAT
ncbi:hypothetical protein SISNIDRAFT_436686 [Sistotremastrum niveocremeum HHB9708]|uniref:Zn(2)-C6 fungal-type domain-containing protein n=1 Tax=Sistotremastrum niveocremeum HHB9708 TaxID=1314777 RepID=A0A164ZQI8_9AGAM|nr:hypothetical protein SISNIDRAFT_436686 [Sistotremastrum niveocremeum HHB9708]